MLLLVELHNWDSFWRRGVTRGQIKPTPIGEERYRRMYAQSVDLGRLMFPSIEIDGLLWSPLRCTHLKPISERITAPPSYCANLAVMRIDRQRGAGPFRRTVKVLDQYLERLSVRARPILITPAGVRSSPEWIELLVTDDQLSYITSIGEGCYLSLIDSFTVPRMRGNAVTQLNLVVWIDVLLQHPKEIVPLAVPFLIDPERHAASPVMELSMERSDIDQILADLEILCGRQSPDILQHYDLIMGRGDLARFTEMDGDSPTFRMLNPSLIPSLLFLAGLSNILGEYAKNLLRQEVGGLIDKLAKTGDDHSIETGLALTRFKHLSGSRERILECVRKFYTQMISL